MAKRRGDGTGSDDDSNDGINSPSCSGSNNFSSLPSTLSATSSSSINAKRSIGRSKPYDANNSFIKKVTAKVSDLIPQNSWISKWINNSQNEEDSQNMGTENSQCEGHEEKEIQPPLKRARIRMDVTHPPGTFSIKPRDKDRKNSNQAESSQEHFSNHNETTQDFLEPTAGGPLDKLPRFVASTPAFPVGTNKVSGPRATLNMLMTEQNNRTTNGADDNSESSESTSGCSSLIPQTSKQAETPNVTYYSPFGKRKFDEEKFSFSNFLQSPRSLLLDSMSRDTLANRRPSFNPSLVNKSSLERSSSLSSPFYSGNTTFGGSNLANLYRSNSVLSKPSQTRLPTRTSVEVNPPSNETEKRDFSGTSTTVRRILETLEQFSSPLTDARKIPVRDVMGGSRSSSSLLGSNTTLNTSRKRLREEETSRVGLRHLTRELIVPTVPDMLKMRRRQRLQNSTMNARKIASTRSANDPSTSAPQKYHIRSEADVEPKGNKNQLKAKKNLDEEKTVEAVDLPTIALPISNLPRFDIPLPKPTNAALQDKEKTPKSNKDDSFKFASPIKLSSETKNLESINNYIFSKPISPSKASLASGESTELSKTLSIDSIDSNCIPESFTNFVWNGPSQTTLKPKEKNKVESMTKGPKVDSELKTGSVMDYFSKPPIVTINDTSDVWECNECLIKNNDKEIYCVACKSARSKDPDDDVICIDDDSDEPEIIMCTKDNKLPKTSTKIFGSTVNPNPSSSIFGKIESITKPQWAKTSAINSLSSASNKSVSETMPKTNTNVSSRLPSTISVSKSLSSLSEFKPANSSWECPCCMVQNANTATTCPCCNTAKPGSVSVNPKEKLDSTISPSISTTMSSDFGDKFKKPAGSWTCDTCMVQNASSDVKCVACETPKPGSTKPSTLSTSSSSLSMSSGVFATASSFGDKFKKPEGSWTCDTCMIDNKSDVVKCVACETPKPGAAPELTKSTSTQKTQFNVDMPDNASSFKFGIDKTSEDSTKSDSLAVKSLPKTNGFTFGSSASSLASTANFSFGVPSTTAVDKDKPVSSDSTKIFTGGFALKPISDSVAATATFQFGTKSTENKINSESVASTATFSFGASTAKTDTKISSGFVFGSPKSDVTDNNKEEKGSKDSKPPSSAFFTFGASPTPAVQTTKDTVGDEKLKPTSETPTNSTFVFGSSQPTFNFSAKVETTPKPASLEPETPKPVTTPSEPLKTTVAQSGFSFNKDSSSSLFKFGDGTSNTAVPATTTSSLPAFGSSDAPKPMFSFSKSAETPSTLPTPSTTQQLENKTPLAFGNSTTSPFGQTNPTSTLFGNNATPSPAASVDSTENKSMFGAPENKIPSGFSEPNAKSPKFGSTSIGNKPTTDSPIFGTPVATPTTLSSNVTTPFGSGSSVFGGASVPNFGSGTTTSIFGSAKPLETTQAAAATPGLFTFGQSSQTSAPTTGGFNFNAGSNASTTSNNANTNEQKSFFTFGQGSSGSVNNGFGGSSTFNAPSATTSNFVFNAPKPESLALGAGPVFGAPNTTTPMFNAPTATPNAPTTSFSAGATNSAPAIGGFNFGNSSVPNNFSFGSSSAPSTGGFNFNAPGGNAPPTFDPNATPSFNFTSGSGAPTTFNAPPARKIKKAVRRMPRQ